MAGKAKSFVSDNPEMLAKWDYEKNAALGIYPEGVGGGCDRIVWWKCNHGHSYDMSVADAKRNGCPVCSGHRLVKGENDFASKHPELLCEFYDKKLSPQDVTYRSTKKALWKCPACENEYYMSFYDRNRGRGCPKCSIGMRALRRKMNTKFEKSLSNLYPEIAIQLDDSNGVSPDIISSKSEEIYVWVCNVCGEKYTQRVCNRVAGKIGCPNCRRPIGTSLPEQIIYYYISKVVDAINRAKVDGLEIDIYIPSKNIGIEYNGEYYHKDRNKTDYEKVSLLRNKGIKMITVQEHTKNGTWEDDKTILHYIYDKSYKGLKHIVEKICIIIGVESPVIDICTDIPLILPHRSYCQNETSFATQLPEIAEEFDYDRNGNLTPWMFSKGSTMEVWWKCSFGHSFKMSFAARARGGGCKYCKGVGKRMIKATNNSSGETSLFPSIAECARELGLNRSTLGDVLRGKYNSSKIGLYNLYKFEYI